MKLVYIASPYRGDVEKNTVYAQEAMLDSLDRGEAPFVPHLLYPQVLNDADSNHREQGLTAATAWISVCSALVVYTDLGISAGMKREIAAAELSHVRVLYRSLGGKWD